MKYLNKPVAYLVDTDFDKNGKLINPKIPKDIPVLLMIQANFCGHCTNSKPEFQKLAEHNKNKIFCATIQGDGKEKGEEELGKRLNNIFSGFRGFPEYMLYENGQFVKQHDGGRSSDDLEKFVFSK
jgi:thiol-disulfide isomerase/thioredoxin